MVSFRTIFASALALSVSAAQLTPAQVVSNIQMITQKSQALQAPAQSITIVNGPLILIGQGPFPQIITGFTDIVSTAVTAIQQMQNMPPVAAGADSDKIFEAFREVRFFHPHTFSQTTADFTFLQQFVRVHQTLLNILIGKAGLFETVPFIGAPVGAVLRQVESVVDVSYMSSFLQGPSILLISPAWAASLQNFHGSFRVLTDFLTDHRVWTHQHSRVPCCRPSRRGRFS
jgi:hypothetical protein